MNSDEKFMLQALELAARGRGAVEPNPMVGAVIVRDGEIIGKGYHEFFGGPHAERNALADTGDIDPAGATMYVTLEPCSHYGKTPPCADALIEAKFARVVVAMVDPDENVAGRGIEKMRAAGIDVEVGVCESQARELLWAYMKLRIQRRPWVLLKWAQTKNGYISLPPESGRWISCEESLKKVHDIRSWCDAILVGISTVLADDPMLNNRSGHGKQPVRVVLDSKLRIPLDCKLVASANELPLTIVTTDEYLDSSKAELLVAAGAEILALPAGSGGIDLAALLDEMGRRNWMNLLVEGGAGVLRSFIADGLADEAMVFVAPFDCEDSAMTRFDVSEIFETAQRSDNMKLISRQTSGQDEMLIYRNSRL